MRPIYLDHNAGAPLDPAAREAMLAHLDAANPSSSHRFGRRARQALEDARETVAELLQAHPDEVVFTSGATEANNLAILGLAGQPPATLAHSGIEHPSVFAPLEALRTRGFSLALLDDLPELVPPPRLGCVQLVNHETGAVLPVADLAHVIPVHCDATQAVGKIPVSFHSLGVASLAFSAHKFGGPRGVGCLLLRRDTRLAPLLHGGHQQQSRRPGTEPVALIAGLAAALRACVQRLKQHAEKMRQLRRLLWEGIQPALLNSPENGLPHVLNVSFPGLASDALLIALDLAGVACSAGAACSSGSLLPSPVLRAMKLPEERLRAALRLSMGWQQTPEEISDAATRIASCVRRLRSLKTNEH